MERSTMPAGARLKLGAIAALAVSTLTGCTGMQLLAWNGSETVDARNPVVEIVCMWQPAEGRDPRGIPSRGFAGQVLFFTRGGKQPVAVEGDVRVYLFENKGSVEQRSKPIHQFDFLGKAWTVHQYKGTLGTTYQVFIPYTKRDPHEVSCSLRVRLTPANGPVIYSDLVAVTLPGPKREDEDVPPGVPQPVAAADTSWETARRPPATVTVEPQAQNAGTRQSPVLRLDRETPPTTGSSIETAGTAPVPRAAATITNPLDDSADRRIRRLENMIEQLLERDQAAAPQHALEASTVPAESNGTSEPRRFKLRPAHPVAESTAEPSASTAATAPQTNPFADGGSSRWQSLDHPLGDQSAGGDSAAAPQHPLQEW